MSDVLGLNSPVDRKPAEMLGSLPELSYDDLLDYGEEGNADPEGEEDET